MNPVVLPSFADISKCLKYELRGFVVALWHVDGWK
jgi:hypothetical protein